MASTAPPTCAKFLLHWTSRISPLVFKQEPDEELIVRIIEKDLPPMLDYLESQIPAGGFIFGDFMMADLSIASPFINAAYAGYEVDESRWLSFVQESGLVQTI